jgi:HSP20 family protein
MVSAKKKETKPEKEKETKEGKDVALEIGGLSFRGLMKGLGNLADLVSKLIEEGETEMTRTGEIKGLDREGITGVYGFRIRTLAGGEPHIESFGNIKKTPQGPRVEEVSEPLVDVFDEPEAVVVIAELPGVEQSDIHLEIKGDILDLKAEGEKRKYRKEVLLPTLVDPPSITSSYKNGILEIKLAKKQK